MGSELPVPGKNLRCRRQQEIVLGESQAVRKALVGRKLCGYNIVVTERFEYLPSEVLVHFDQRREGVAVGRS